MYPSLSQFLQWAGQYKAIPVWVEPDLPAGEILPWVRSLVGAQQKFFFFHSPSTNSQARYSYIALESPRYTLHVQDGDLTVRYQSESQGRLESLKVGNPLERLHEWLSYWTGPRVEALPPFWGGAVGYFGYESSRYMDSKLASLFQKRRADTEAPSTESFPDFEWSVYDAVAAVDHARRRLWLVHTVLLPPRKNLSPAQLERLYRSAQDRLRRQAVRFQRAIRQRKMWGPFQTSDLRSNRSEPAYRLMVRRAKGHIAAGDIYQANLSQSFSASWEGDPWTLYRQLTTINPSPYAALWRSGTRWMVSASPELLLRKEANHVETRPIAGTYPRGRTPSEDERILRSLISDAKERAEHVMMVDLERNDLSRVCVSPSVRVAEALTVESYSHVFHLVSDIRGQLVSGKTWKDLLQASFPGGTITGCPKLRCMELIHKLEPLSRGPYCGSLGWIGYNGDMTLNILIRTFFLDKGRLRFPVGAGIVADSNPQREYQETLHKAEALMQALYGRTVTSPLFPPRTSGG